MTFKNALKKPVRWLCEEFLGKSNKPVYTVAAVAVFKGIFRPTFTMMDKKQDPDTKKYAAVREGATELIAIPTYIGLSALTEWLAPAFSPKGKDMHQILHSSKATLGFFGVCIAALYAIPKFCNMAMPHIMKAMKMNKSEKTEGMEPKVLNIETKSEVENVVVNKPVQSAYSKTPISMNGGMRI